MHAERKVLYKKVQAKRKSRVIALVTGDRPGQEAQIGKDVVDLLGPLLDKLKNPKKISLILYTQGGDTLAAWSLVNLLREFCDDLEVILPSKCYSAGTLVCLGADRIVMAKQACLGPIDPSVNGPLNPQIPNRPPDQKLPLSVEDVAGYISLATDEGQVPSDGLTNVFLKLANDVHPLALGRVKRARGQIQDLAHKLLARHMDDKEHQDRIIKVLCSEAGSHDYAIYRTEARKELGLNIESPSMALYGDMRAILDNFSDEMQLSAPFSLASIAAPLGSSPAAFASVRALIETADNGGYQYVTRSTAVRIQGPQGNLLINHDVQSDGWEASP